MNAFKLFNILGKKNSLKLAAVSFLKLSNSYFPNNSLLFKRCYSSRGQSFNFVKINEIKRFILNKIQKLQKY